MTLDELRRLANDCICLMKAQRHVLREMLREMGLKRIGLARLYCYRQGVFWLVEVPREQASSRQRELTQEGWCVTSTDIV